MNGMVFFGMQVSPISSKVKMVNMGKISIFVSLIDQSPFFFVCFFVFPVLLSKDVLKLKMGLILLPLTHIQIQLAESFKAMTLSVEFSKLDKTQ